MSAPTELLKGNATILILTCLAKEPMHGYKIVKELDRMSESYFQMREGTLYPHLHQLEENGLIESYWERQAGARERKIYRITSRGKAELARLQTEWRSFQINLNRILEQGAGA